MAIYEVTKWMGGISDYEDRGITGAYKFGKNLNGRKKQDSLTCAQALIDEGLLSSKSPSSSTSPSLSASASPSLSPSLSISPTPSPSSSVSLSASTTPSVSVSLSPSTTPSASISLSPSPSAGLSTVFEDLIRFFVKASDGYLYGFGSTGHIYRRDGDGLWIWVYTDPDGEIKGAEEKPSSGGKAYLYWATNTKVKYKEIPGLSNWNDVTVLAQDLFPDVPHTMRQVGGALMIANKSWLALVGYDDSYTNEAIDMIPGNIAKTLVERNGRVITGCYKAYTSQYKGINAAIDAEYPLCQVGDDGELFFADMTNSMPIKRFPGGGKVNPGGVCNYVDQVQFFEWEQTASSWIDKQEVGNLSLWAVWGADAGYNGIYSYGRKFKDHPVTLTLDYALEADELGAITVFDGTILVSYRDGTTFGVMAVDSTTKATGDYQGLDFKAPVKKPAEITYWTMEELFFDPLPSGTSIAFYYRVNKTGSWIQARTADGEMVFDTANAKKAVFSIASEGEIFEPRIVLNPSFNVAPEVYRARTYFE